MKAKPYRICLIEDDLIMGEALSDRLGLEDFECDWFKTGQDAIQALGRKRYDAVISDIQLPDINGEDLFVQLKETATKLPPFVFTTGYGTIDRAVRLLKLGAHDYLTKPLDIRALLDTVKFLCIQSRPAVAGDNNLGISSAMRTIESLLPRVAANSTSVLITGESGVGKEWVARALHHQHDPADKTPFIAVNCGALTKTLLEAELFGHVRGAFTGAVREKKGVFELANGGTLFLDEIGEMSPTMQVKLLRAIQERQIVRVGGETLIPVSIRLICATHQDLKKMVEVGKFREDLYYRIHVIHLHIPPLRERKEDILWLAGRLLKTCAAGNCGARTLLRSAEKALLDYPWPGNVRELKHCLERSCILSQKKGLTAELLFDDLPSAPPEQFQGAESLNEFLHACERKYIEDRLSANGGRIAETAAALGISRKNLWEKMKKLEIHNEAAQ
ncbi:MAG: sigma-54 dependent transcriptional regulator [Gammaproteobacteria bacterium]|nr:sigma-54 dependent transcriptional regulator [Gammaproteobacteria bacterium]